MCLYSINCFQSWMRNRQVAGDIHSLAWIPQSKKRIGAKDEDTTVQSTVREYEITWRISDSHKEYFIDHVLVSNVGIPNWLLKRETNIHFDGRTVTLLGTSNFIDFGASTDSFFRKSHSSGKSRYLGNQQNKAKHQNSFPPRRVKYPQLLARKYAHDLNHQH